LAEKSFANGRQRSGARGKTQTEVPMVPASSRPSRHREGNREARRPPAVERELALLGPVERRTVHLVCSIGGRPAELARLLGVRERTIRAVLAERAPLY
jgi:hypothetical protein